MKLFNKDFTRRFLLMLLGIVGMGVFLSFLIEVNFGLDTSTFLNMALSEKFHISFGLCMILVNLVLFIPQLIFGRKLINIGTILNMTLIGNISDLCRHLWALYLPGQIFIDPAYRTTVFVLALIPFLISVALYMNANLGQVPYDAAPTLLTKALKLPFPVVRICWDFTAIIIGLLLGRALTVGTVIMALSIGPSVTLIGKLLDPRSKNKAHNPPIHLPRENKDLLVDRRNEG
ncbi:YczE/YyaS/YitT family protein [Spirochaeta cellobiosiphila]|uniref:YczE/YyaS/YitT family protein n=1 Tax=Spirochaeta cellobiosiphila TaxID=504483 RepID=UPI0003F6CF6F|nr:membrane protein [Spirochaeta cellobiosiphila]